LLDPAQRIKARPNFLTIGTGEPDAGKVTLNLGKDAQYWAAGADMAVDVPELTQSGRLCRSFSSC
jgi:hypothetical protein